MIWSDSVHSTTFDAFPHYEIPREATIDDVASALDCAPATAAEHLRKAESAVLADLFGDES